LRRWIPAPLPRSWNPAADIASLSPSVTLSAAARTAARQPSFIIRRVGAEAGGPTVQTEFAGIPMGHEFTSLVLALLQTGGYPPKIAPEIIEQIRALDGEFHFETYISLSCQNCPDVVQALNAMAVINPNIAPRDDRRRAVPERSACASASWPCRRCT
jgi:alkyl hydroperoxide reductase subunit F